MVELRDQGVRVRLRQQTPIPLEVTLDCAPGQLLALVGPSGGGKSTILRAIAGLNRPTEGCITCGDEAWLDTEHDINLPPQRRSVGFVFQSYALFPHLSALENVTAAQDHLPPRDRVARARELLETVRLEGLEDRRPAALSGGQQQRVALARALARDPSVLLLDEPFSAVDQVTRGKLQEELARLRRQLKIPIILVTHDLNEATALADRMCIIHHGKTLQTGAPREVMSRPLDSTVARLVNHRNLFDGVVMGHRPEADLTFLRWRDHTLEVAHHPAFKIGAEVNWVIPSSKVILHRADRPSRGDWENPVKGIIGEMVALGDTVRLTVLTNGAEESPLVMELSLHVVQRNGLGIGIEVSVSLLGAAIHLMARRQGDEDGS